jgi:hypothetical protein
MDEVRCPKVTEKLHQEDSVKSSLDTENRPRQPYAERGTEWNKYARQYNRDSYQDVKAEPKAPPRVDDETGTD